MANISINYQTLLDTAAEIERYCETQRTKMQTMDSVVKSLVQEGWAGDDAAAFLKQWEFVDEDAATAAQFQKALKRFADTLTECANAYKKAHQKVYTAACLLPRK